MRFGHSETCLAHETGPRHPETPDRIRAIREGLAEHHGVEYVESDPVAVDRVTRVHDPDYIEEIRAFCERGGGRWDQDTVACPETWEAALASAGLACWAATEATGTTGMRDTPFSIGRPPGHHAVAGNAMGFCFINNAAVAAQFLLDTHDQERVAIFDWDVHHGNGTQDIFYDRGDVVYASIHEEGLYPGTGPVNETGAGEGAGATINVPLAAGASDADYRVAFDNVIDPVLAAADPDILLVSAGFDAHEHDPISRMRLTTEGYAMLTDRVRTVADRCDTGLGFILEGGYSLDMLADGVGIVHEVMAGYEPIIPDDDPSDATQRRIQSVRETHGLGSK